MLDISFCDVYDKFKLQFYRRVFDLVRERDGSLSAMDKISQSNATYKVNNLIKKGYLDRRNSTSDRREYHLVLTDKFYAYRDLFANYEKTVMGRVEERLPREDVECFDRILQIMSAELMPECSK